MQNRTSKAGSLRAFALAGVGAVFLLSACGNGQDAGSAQMQGQQQAARVEVMTVSATQAPSVRVLSGRAHAFAIAEIRPQVTGLIQKRLFTEGQQVKEGDSLYLIDAREYRAAVDSALADLRGAEASAAAARETSKRFEHLAEINAVSRQDYDEAVATMKRAEAEIGIKQAALSRARIDLERTNVRTPISGQIGRSSVTPGALVTANQAESLSRVLQLDPIYIDMTAASSEVLRWKRQVANGEILGNGTTNAVPVKVYLEDDQQYALEGSLEFSEVSVDEAAGTVIVRAVVPNPDGFLLPGMFVKAEFSAGSLESVYLIPQKAVTRTPRGEAAVYIATADGQAEQRLITLQGAQESNWIVTDGLKDGDRVITSGFQSIRPGVQLAIVEKQASFAAAVDPNEFSEN